MDQQELAWLHTALKQSLLVASGNQEAELQVFFLNIFENFLPRGNGAGQLLQVGPIIF